MAPQPIKARIEVFRPGTFTPMDGEPISYSAADLRAIADAYDASGAPAPIVIGHPDVDAPAFGWVSGFDYDAQAGRLFADLDEIEPQFAEMVKAGRFRKVSMSFFSPQAPHNPVPGTWYPKHVGFLGAAAPAVSGLKPARFSGEGGVTFEAAFGSQAAEQTASLLRSLRDFFIEKFGLEEADKALPSWSIEWLGEADDPAPAPSFTAPPGPPRTQEPPVTKPDPAADAAFAAREAQMTERETRLAAREAELRHDDNAAFAEKLVAEGRVIPASKDKIVAILDALPGEPSVAFADGGAKISPAQAIRELLEAQPKIVTFGAADLGDDPTGKVRPANFAADGLPVDPAGLAIHNKAIEYQRQHPATAYLDAVKAVS